MDLNGRKRNARIYFKNFKFKYVLFPSKGQITSTVFRQIRNTGTKSLIAKDIWMSNNFSYSRPSSGHFTLVMHLLNLKQNTSFFHWTPCRSSNLCSIQPLKLLDYYMVVQNYYSYWLNKFYITSPHSNEKKTRGKPWNIHPYFGATTFQRKLLWIKNLATNFIQLTVDHRNSNTHVLFVIVVVRTDVRASHSAIQPMLYSMCFDVRARRRLLWLVPRHSFCWPCTKR